MSSPAEHLLISAILRTENFNLASSRGIADEMFYGYQEEFSWIRKYYMKYSKTPSTAAFRQVFDSFPMKKVDDIELYIEEVRESHSTQVVIQGLRDTMNKLKSGDVAGAIKKLSSVSMTAETSLLGSAKDGNIFEDYEDIEAEALRRAKKLEDTGFSGIPTGFPTLDELTGGIQPGWFCVVSARAGIGKTRSLIRMACAAAFSGYTVQYDALEQARYEIGWQVQTFASSEFGQGVMRSLDLAQGRVDTFAYKKFLQSMRSTIQGKMHVADNRSMAITPPVMAAQIQKNKVDVLYLDYLTIMEGAEGYENAANLSKTLARMSKKYGVPIITAAQINRNGADRKEQGLEHLSDTDELGRSADLVINVQQFSKRVLCMTVVKFRHGPSGQKFFLRFDPNLGVMEEITYEEAISMQDADEAGGSSKAPVVKKFVPRKKGSFHESAMSRKQDSAGKTVKTSSRRVVADTKRTVTKRGFQPDEQPRRVVKQAVAPAKRSVATKR